MPASKGIWTNRPCLSMKTKRNLMKFMGSNHEIYIADILIRFGNKFA